MSRIQEFRQRRHQEQRTHQLLQDDNFELV